MDVVLVANSPGELSALVKPLAETLVRESANRVMLVLTPCQYSSGKELSYVKTIKGLEAIITAAEYKNWVIFNQKPKATFDKSGVVLYVGGDLAHAVLVARKLHYPAYAYVQDFIGWKRTYKKFFVPDEQSRNKLDPKGSLGNRIQIVGNLMVDSVADLPSWSPPGNTVTFLPGSRSWQIKHMTPLYAKIISELTTHNSQLTTQLVSSPFEPALPISGVTNIRFDEAHNSDLIITIPGTNTARLAARGIPMLVVFPLDNPDVIPLEGLAHYICSVPRLGSWLKRRLADIINKRTRFFALPNIKADREIVPEVRGVIDPKEIAEKVLSLLQNRPALEKMSRELKQAMGPTGAAARIARELSAT